ncbi:hypothetical protein BMF77_04404 [Dolichospermum sp. UHCC 0315A]|nr:hypothetical protein [Dolichospermum sp. UHCC 0315A]QEI41130.1 hypothetical protein BMF77_01713 [Dolichospermum sp. UHCC 0315A]QEI43781.1 hypothetical protein BMF77_04404 [Dolichospermum sp. UHCC 0315A]
MTIAIESLRKAKFAQIGVQVVSPRCYLDYPLINTEVHTQKFPSAF